MLTGIVPSTLNDDSSPLPLTIPLEMTPVDYQVINGVRCFKPISQLAVEGLIWAGCEDILFTVNERKLDLMRYYRGGQPFGIPISYCWQESGGLIGAINSCYHQMRGKTVIMALPGILDPKTISQVLKDHRTTGATLSMSVSQNTPVHDGRHITQVKIGQMTGVFVWEPSFTEYMREAVVELQEDLEGTIEHAIEDGFDVHGVKLPYMPLVQDCMTWTKAVHMVIQRPAFVVNRED